MPHVDIGAQRAVGVGREGGDERLGDRRVASDERADDVSVHVGPGSRVPDDPPVLLGHAQLVGEGGQSGDDVCAVGPERLLVEPEDGGEVLGGRGTGGDLGIRSAGSEVPAHHLRPPGDLEAEFLVEGAAVRCRVQGEGRGAHR